MDEMGGKLEDVLVLALRGSRLLVDLEASRKLHESMISRYTGSVKDDTHTFFDLGAHLGQSFSDDSDELGVVDGVTLNVGRKVEAIDFEDVLNMVVRSWTINKRKMHQENVFRDRALIGTQFGGEEDSSSVKVDVGLGRSERGRQGG
jgi:hypothetical protein